MKKMSLAAVSIIIGLLSITSVSWAALITPSGITGYGAYNNNADIIVDGTIPSNGTGWTDGQCVYWNGTEPYFVINLGGVYNLDSVTASVDNNDDYAIQSSMNNTDWSSLLAISRWDGTVGWGMDTLGGSVNVSAQYLKIYATGGDNCYSVGELQASGSGAKSAVPEPSSMLLLGLGGLVTGLFKKRKKIS
jgi:hypothetical protein